MQKNSPNNESDLLKAVKIVHKIIDKEVDAGTNPSNVFVCGFSQGGALTLASVLLYPKTLGGGAVFSGWVPFSSSIIEQIPPEAKRVVLLEDIEDQLAEKLVAICPVKVFDIDGIGKGKKRATIARPRACTLWRECIREGKGWENAISLRSKDHFMCK